MGIGTGIEFSFHDVTDGGEILYDEIGRHVGSSICERNCISFGGKCKVLLDNIGLRQLRMKRGDIDFIKHII